MQLSENLPEETTLTVSPTSSTPYDTGRHTAPTQLFEKPSGQSTLTVSPTRSGHHTAPTQHAADHGVVEGEKEWEVDRILDSQRYRGKLRYLVAWKGYPPAFMATIQKLDKLC